MALPFKELLCLTLIGLTLAVDKSNFKTCEQSSFCRRLRGVKPGESKYELKLDTLKVTDSSVEATLTNTEANANFQFIVSSLTGNIFRVFIDEVKPLHPRYQVKYALNGEPLVTKLEVLERNEEQVVVQFKDNKAVILAKPFKVEFYKNDQLVSVLNGRGLFKFEHLRVKTPVVEGEEAPQEDPGAWEENFKSHHDSKPRGPEAIGFDISFPNANRIYGLPDHADKLPLRTTGSGGLDPYRLYNLDVFEYEVESTMAIYGAVPVVYAHSSKHTVGAFWHNAAETWVDISNSKDGNVMSSIVNLVSGQKTETRVDAHFMSETGVFDLFVLMGPTPKDCVRQFATLTGVAPLQQYVTLGYHQCRWNYNDQDDVVSVIDNFDKVDMPVDFIWLDIEYTNSKKYFTWDPIRFSNPEAMINNLTATGRKLIVIIDPHIKRESGYFLHEDALANDYYVKTKDGKVYEGWCWPGASSYLDFYDPKTREYFRGLYGFDKFKGTTDDVYIWNDMNEPSVFNGPEITMPKDCLHYGNVEHRALHNENGLTYTMVTHEALLKRTPNKRPFILTRSHFAGSQRYCAMWTGDNDADWSHLAISYPMCLSVALGGLSNCGADIGGFFHNPDVELLQRWYQAAVWLPFFRAHAHIDTRRREPYLFSEDVQNRIRTSLQLRYSHLPLLYTLFWEHEVTGDPVIRPLFYEFPADEKVFDIDNELLVGSSVLARPVTEAEASSVNVYLPGGSSQYWYDIDDFKRYTGTGNVNIPVTLDKSPAFYRGGVIIPRKNRPRRSSLLMKNDPFTLYVALDANLSAQGTLYVDDYESFEYKNKQYLYINLKYERGILTSSLLDKTDYPTKEWIEKIVILGPPSGITGAKLNSKSLGEVKLETSYDGEQRSLVIRKPGVSLREPFSIKLF